MKAKNFSFVMMAVAATLFLSSCNGDKDPDTVNGDIQVKLSQSSVTVAVGVSVTLTAEVTPSGSPAVQWASENPAVAMVTNGVVIGVAEGTTKITATSGTGKAECTVEVTAGGSGVVDYSKFACLQGDNYFPTVLGQGALDYLTSRGKTITWIGANGSGTDADGDGKVDNSQNLWYWSGSIATGTPMSNNFFGALDGYLCVSQTADLYGGCGFAIGVPAETTNEVVPIDMSDIYAHPEQYYFHIALAQPDAGQFSISFLFTDGVQNGKNEAYFTFGNKSGLNSQMPRADIPRNGMWYEYEIPCTEFIAGDKMLYQKPFYDANLMAMYMYNPIAGATAHIDAAFFYKK